MHIYIYTYLHIGGLFGEASRYFHPRHKRIHVNMTTVSRRSGGLFGEASRYFYRILYTYPPPCPALEGVWDQQKQPLQPLVALCWILFRVSLLSTL